MNCPFCQKKIRISVLRCPHCTAWLQDTPEMISAIRNELIGYAVVGGIIAALWLLL